MLYCPKCQKTYEEGSQRFCSNEGEKLLSTSAAASGESANQKSGVFTYTLNRKNKGERSKFAAIPEILEDEAKTAARPPFIPPPDKAFKSDLNSAPEIGETSVGAAAQKEQISSEKRAEKRAVFDEEITFSFDDPSELIRRTIKNRYRVVEQIGADENGIAYLAADKSSADKRVALKILSVEDAEDSFTNDIFAAERLALAQIVHPNIASVFDSGELSDGKPYLVTEYIEGISIKEELEKNKQFDALRAARVVRQAADALEAAHENRVLHRSLKPEDIILHRDENGVERVKVTNFGNAREKLDERNLLYKSPEQIEGKISSVNSDVYTLAVIAYQMLTGRLPFNASSVGDLLKSQREGLRIRPSDVRFDLPGSVDDILKKALSFNSSNRFTKARDFGDEFFGEIIAHATVETEAEADEETPAAAAAEKTISVPPIPNETDATNETITAAGNVQTQKPSIQETVKRQGKKTARKLSGEKASFDPSKENDPRHRILPIFGVAVLLAALLGVAYYFVNRPNRTLVVQKPDAVNVNAAPKPVAANSSVAATSKAVEMPPLARSIKPPPDTVYFQNNKDDLTDEAARNFLGFSLYYPKDWTRKAVENNFLDVARVAKNNLPIEQMLVSYYNSNGTFNADAEIFPILVRETNATLEKIVPDYQMVSEGPQTVNNGWRAYEVKFQGTGRTAGGEVITLWGRRLFVPRAIRGMKNGYVLTMLATSLSANVKNVDDVGVKGELANVLQTFEPNQNF